MTVLVTGVLLMMTSSHCLLLNVFEGIGHKTSGFCTCIDEQLYYQSDHFDIVVQKISLQPVEVLRI